MELDRRQILKWAERHFDHHARYDAIWSKLDARLEPAHFELRFGPPRSGEGDGDDPHSCDDAFTLTIRGEPVRVTGRIDRIDVARVGERVVFNVIDYKSGRKVSLKEEHISSGEHLQLPIYVAAAQALLFDGDAQPLAAGYWTMAGGFDAKGVLAVQHDDGESRQHWSKMQATVEELIGQFIDSIRRGQFPVFSRDEQCTSRCDFNTICRITQIRSLGKAVESQVADSPWRKSRVESQKPGKNRPPAPSPTPISSPASSCLPARLLPNSSSPSPPAMCPSRSRPAPVAARRMCSSSGSSPIWIAWWSRATRPKQPSCAN